MPNLADTTMDLLHGNTKLLDLVHGNTILLDLSITESTYV